MSQATDIPVYDQTDHGIYILEEERRRIARDLHDGPAQSITNVAMKVDIIAHLVDQNPEMAKSMLKQMYTKLSDTAGEIRHLIFDIRPIAIDEVGLILAVEELCNHYNETWPSDVHMAPVDQALVSDIAPAKQVALYRLVQEILNNMKKHAKAKQISVTFTRSAHELQIVATDDGKGFDPTVIPVGHYGLVGMRERAAYLGGSLNIDSIIGKGSKFTVKVPV